MKAIAEQHDKGVGAIILRWLNQRNIVVIPKSVHKERMIENFNILDFTLSKEEMDAIALLETGKSPIYDDMDLLTVKGIGLHKSMNDSKTNRILPLKTESYADCKIEQRHRNAGIRIWCISSIARRVRALRTRCHRRGLSVDRHGAGVL